MGRAAAVTKATTAPLTTSDLPNKRKNAKWTVADDDTLLKELLGAKATGGMVEGGFKQAAFKPIAKALDAIRTSGGEKTASACQTRTKAVSFLSGLWDSAELG
jgi:hypothetical protein